MGLWDVAKDGQDEKEKEQEDGQQEGKKGYGPNWRQRQHNRISERKKEQDKESIYKGLDREGWGKGDFIVFSKEEFETILDNMEYEFEEVDTSSGKRFSQEIVYESIDLGFPLHPNLVLRIFSTVDKRSMESRGKGNDSIKCVVWDKELERPIGGRSYTKRLGTMPENLNAKAADIIEQYEKYITSCDECGAWLVERENSKDGNKFLGCVRYPDCKNTAPVQ